MVLFGLCYLFVNVAYSLGVYIEVSEFLFVREVVDELLYFIDRYSDLCNCTAACDCMRHSSILNSVNRFQVISGLVLVLLVFLVTSFLKIRGRSLVKCGTSKLLFDSSIAHHRMLVLHLMSVLFFFCLTWLFPDLDGRRWFVRGISELYVFSGGALGSMLDFVLYFLAYVSLYNALLVAASWFRLSQGGE
ncbi:hypothetical protein [Sneathiella glossodoripedis]|uniref:hypothetical protein n=1 Tax=Sneathiella glossodoripedis TaxID=418853 RepID=UPI00047202AF|nr:hypothetical protein [Sneathiella glossodoripedis]